MFGTTKQRARSCASGMVSVQSTIWGYAEPHSMFAEGSAVQPAGGTNSSELEEHADASTATQTMRVARLAVLMVLVSGCGARTGLETVEIGARNAAIDDIQQLEEDSSRSDTRRDGAKASSFAMKIELEAAQ
jgi:hypothetical protein